MSDSRFQDKSLANCPPCEVPLIDILKCLETPATLRCPKGRRNGKRNGRLPTSGNVIATFRAEAHLEILDAWDQIKRLPGTGRP